MKKFYIPAVITALLGMFSLLTLKKNDNNRIVLSSDNTVLFRSDVDSSSVSSAIKTATELSANLPEGKPLYLVLDTSGGSILYGHQLIDSLKGLGRPVHTVTITAMSMGFQIVQSLDNRYVINSSILMSHRANGEVSGEFGGMNDGTLEKRLFFWKSVIDEFDIQTVKRTKGKHTLESYRAAYENELWLTGTEAVKQGFADAIVQIQCDKSLLSSYKETIEFFGLKIHAEFSRCPIISGPLSVSAERACKKSNEKTADNNSQSECVSDDLLNKIYEEIKYMYSIDGKIAKARRMRF